MLPEGTLRADHVWKRFRADRNRRQLRDKVTYARARLTGRSSRGWRWALRDVCVVAEPGDSIGLVGVNGSGKSTLLKLLSRVMYPYAGSVNAAGRVGALIEVRAGLHPELTGRENVYLYGSLLGLRRKEVAGRFDQIVDFAEVDDAVDRQMKFYSSGMQMRLGFAVAAFLEPAILLVDEVLAVGDASFQQKCLDRMRQVLAQGTTLVYVSHDLPTVESTCFRGVWLHEGTVRAEGTVTEVLEAYRGFFERDDEYQAPEVGLIHLAEVEAVGGGGNGIHAHEPLDVRLVIDSPEARPATIHIGVGAASSNPVFLVQRGARLAEGKTIVRCRVDDLPLPGGRFSLWIGVSGKRNRDLLPWHRVSSIQVVGPRLDPPPRGVVRAAPVQVASSWSIE